VGKPEPSEYAAYYRKYVDLVEGDDVLAALEGQIGGSLATLRGVAPEDSLRRYAPGKWSLRELVGHLIDSERIFAYRALRFARRDRAELPGFEQDDYVAAAASDERAWSDLLAELEAVRRTTVLLFRGLRPEAWLRRGVANGNEISVRALAWAIAGHERHHLGIVRDRYLAPAGIGV
jgi:hypothetical protein